MGATIAVAMEAGIAEFGDAEAAIKLVKEVGGDGTARNAITAPSLFQSLIEQCAE